jgi:hypothetical protein
MGAVIEMELLDERRDWRIDVDGVIVDTAADTTLTPLSEAANDDERCLYAVLVTPLHFSAFVLNAV